ncbi:hypothetical protein R1sor_024227 [Riccia sorocarpa]|uniref:Uncharacterized protein n=1 Tax=Riccia sorocarpa TaxID=122646 RepID=A0ABD3GRR7_9MARC
MGLNEWEGVGTWTSSVKQCTRTKTSDSRIRGRLTERSSEIGSMGRTEMVKGKQRQCEAAAYTGEWRFATGKKRVSSKSLVSRSLQGMNSSLFGGLVIGNCVSDATDFKSLDDRAAEILKKSMQALQSSHGLDVTHGWACDKFEHSVPRSFQHTETSADVSSGTLGRELLDSRNIQLKCSEASAFRLKVGGTSSQKKERSFEKDLTGVVEEHTPARITSNPNKCNVETNHVDKILQYCRDDGDGRGKVKPHRWARMSATPPSGQMNDNFHLNEEITTDNFSQNFITEDHLKNSAEAQENGSGGYRSNWQRSGLPEAEWCQTERTRCCVKEHAPGTFDISSPVRRTLSRYGLCQGASGWPSSGADSRRNDHLLECLNKLDIPDRSEKTSTAWTMPASLKRSVGAEKHHTPTFKEESIPAESSSLKSAEHLQDANKSSNLDWNRPCMPLVHFKAKDLSAKGNYEAPSDRPLDGIVHSPSAPETTSKTPDVSSLSAPGSLQETPDASLLSAPEPTSATPAATTYHRTLETPPTLKSLMPHRKTLPVNLVSRRGRMDGTKKRRLVSTEVKAVRRESRRIETVQNGIFFAPQKARTAVKVNIKIMHLVEKEQLATNGMNDPLKPTREHKGAQTQAERVRNGESSKDFISAETIGHPETKTNKKLPPRITSAETVKTSNECVCQLLTEDSQIPQLPSKKLPVERTKPTGKDADNDLENSVRGSAKLNEKQKSQEDHSWKSTVIRDSRTPPRAGNQRAPTGVRFWPTEIPKLDDWIHEAVSGLFQKEESLFNEQLEGTSVTVYTQGSSDGPKTIKPVKLETSTSETSRGINPSKIRVESVSKLDTDIKRLAMLDSRINQARSIRDLLQIMEGISSSGRSKPQCTKQTERSTNPVSEAQ